MHAGLSKTQLEQQWKYLHEQFQPWHSSLVPGSNAGKTALESFLISGLIRYGLRNDPNAHASSRLSAWLHFGQLAPQRVALEVRKLTKASAGNDNPLEELQADFLEELIIRRELSDNFCFYNQNYDQTAAFPEWAKTTLRQHQADPRPHIYSLHELEAAETTDPLWNAAQQEMVISGWMPGYLRMYWAKKILEWSTDAETAQTHAIALNDRYLLDGRDPNGYAGIAWSIGGIHDRAWNERPVFGKVRTMTYAGCRRKFSVDQYIQNASAG
jgi:deoxyribodipyrimidine photo-lyase